MKLINDIDRENLLETKEISINSDTVYLINHINGLQHGSEFVAEQLTMVAVPQYATRQELIVAFEQFMLALGYRLNANETLDIVTYDTEE